MKGSSAVLIHGLYLGVPDWHAIMIGESAYGKEGRILRGLKIAYEENAHQIFWGTGASEMDGVKEGQYIYDYALAHLPLIAEHLNANILLVKHFIESRSVINIETKNTREEIGAVMTVLARYDIKQLFIVSSPTHGGRCFTEGEVLRLSREFAPQQVRIFATGSDVSYEGSSPKDVVIIEPPHRGDRVHEYPLSVTARKAMRLSRSPQGVEFLKALSEFVDSWAENK